MRLLWQSCTKPGTRYLATLQSTLRSLVSSGTQVDVDGLDPADGFVHHLSELRCANQVFVWFAFAAERGYDAVVVGHFQDGGLLELRSILDIPVVGLGEAAIHHALQLGDRFGLVTINPGFLAFHRRQVRAYQQEAKFAGVRAMNTDAATYQAAFDGDLAQVERVSADFARAGGPGGGRGGGAAGAPRGGRAAAPGPGRRPAGGAARRGAPTAGPTKT